MTFDVQEWLKNEEQKEMTNCDINYVVNSGKNDSEGSEAVREASRH